MIRKSIHVGIDGDARYCGELFPMVEAAGLDLIWFGIFLVIVVEISQTRHAHHHAGRILKRISQRGSIHAAPHSRARGHGFPSPRLPLYQTSSRGPGGHDFSCSTPLRTVKTTPLCAFPREVYRLFLLAVARIEGRI